MRRLIVLVFLLVAAPAQAAPLGEVPYQQLPVDQNATCLRPTGAPGELALYAPRATDLLEGTTRTARVRLGRLDECAATAAAGDAAVLAAPVLRSGDRVQVRAALRDPGGGFGAPVALGAADRDRPSVAAAVSPAGDAVVAWLQADDERHRVVAVRRWAGGAFGAVEPLTPWRRPGEFANGGSVVAGMSSSGVATIAWAIPRPDRGREPLLFSVGTARALRGGRFVHQALAKAAQEVNRVALAVAPGGWALLAYDDTTGLHALERAPGADRFTPAVIAKPNDDVFGAAMPVVAVRDGGGGLVAWRLDNLEPDAAVIATTRPAAGAFPAPRTVAPETSRESFGDAVAVVGFAGSGGGPSDFDGGALRAALAADGRALLTWTTSRRDTVTATFAAGTLAAGFGRPAALSSPLRDVNGVAPLLLADGRTAVGWTDNATSFGFPVGQGRLHLAVEGAPAPPEPERPRVTVTAAREQHLYDSQPVRLRVRCDRACDVRAALPGVSEPPDVEAHSLRRAGALPLSLSRLDFRRKADGQRLRIRVRAGAPNAHDTLSLSRRVLVLRRPPLPVPRLLDVRAVRRGRTIVVSWRTEFPARRTFFSVLGQRTRKLGPDTFTDLQAFASRRGRGRTHFRVRMRPARPAAVKWIGVYAFSFDRTPGHRALVELP